MSVELESDWLPFARELAMVGGAEAMRFFRRAPEIENKAEGGAYDPVTEGDRASEASMRQRIEARFPEHGILGEEFGVTPGRGPWRWVLDPIDGTRGFVCGTPTWTTLVGLEHDQAPVIGVIHQPVTGETWVGGPDGTTLWEQQLSRPIQTSQTTTLREARLSTTDPRSRPHGILDAQEADAFERVANQVRLTRFGHDAYAYALLATGCIDLVIEAGLQRYDVAALAPVVRGAGGIISDWTGAPAHGGGRVLAAATRELHAAALDALGA